MHTKQDACNRTWFPILCGVLLGMIIWIVIGSFETTRDYLSHLLLGKVAPKELFAHPYYYPILRIACLGFVLLGGLVGVYKSQWPVKVSAVFLLVIMASISIPLFFVFPR